MYKRLIRLRDEARAARDVGRTTVLATLIGEIQRLPNGYQLLDGERVYNDETCLKVIKKMAESSGELLAKAPDNDVAAAEVAFLKSLLPTMLTEAEITEILLEVGPPDIGAAMKHLKQHHTGLYDGKVAKAAFDKISQ